MNCPQCQASNPDQAKFCMQCGSPLANNCPECGTELPAQARFCFNCGNQLGAPAAPPAAPTPPPPPPEPVAPEPTVQERLHQYIPPELLSKLESARASGGMMGERRVVTMLFCDVQGSTQAAENLDPEEWAEIMNGAFSRLIEPVYEYEGTLARLMGDAILAFFGAPIAHEDDPQRAVLAALGIIEGIQPYRQQVKRQWGIDFNVRVGINTGLVVVGEVGSDLRVEYTALGDAVNLAARMEQTAIPGSVQISADTHRLIAPLFDFEPLGEIEVRGRAESVASYRVIGAKAEPGQLRGIEGLDSPLIGRQRELDTLIQSVDGLRAGNGQLVSIMGEAGLGKSRLLAELRRYLVEHGYVALRGDSADATSGGMDSDIGWYEGRSYSYQTATPYAPFVSLFKSLFNIQPDQSDAEQYEYIVGRISRVLGDRVDDVAPYLASMLGIELEGLAAQRVQFLDPPQMKERVFAATAELVERASLASPRVLVFDDLHWVDPTSLELIEQLMPITDRAPLMIICMFRPWTQEPSWTFHEKAMREYGHRYAYVQLQPLNANQSRELVANLLEVEDLPESVRAMILERSDGNPFFVEEVIRSLLDAELVVRRDGHWYATQEIVNIAVPDTLAGVITARLDRLDDDAKRVAQTSAVIGREFHYDALQSIYESEDSLDTILTDLQRREMIREKSRFPDRVYIFKHALTQETAYESLLMSQRRRLHGRVAEYLEQADSEQVDDIGRHFLEARASDRALPYLVEAGDRNAHNYATQEAIGLYRQSLNILNDHKDVGLSRRAYEGLGGALMFSGDIPSTVENYHQMLHEAEEFEDLPMQVSALNKIAFVTAATTGEYPQAEEHLVEAERLAVMCGDDAGLAEMHMNFCFLKTPVGDFDEATEHLEEAKRLGQNLAHVEAQLFGLTHISNVQVCMTDFDKAWETANEGLELARSTNSKKWESVLLGEALALCHMRNGDLVEAARSAQEGLDIANQIGSAEAQATCAWVLGEIHWMMGEYERAAQLQEQAKTVSEGAGMFYLTAPALSALGMARLDISDEFVDEVMAVHKQALEMTDMPFGEAYGGLIWAELGFCAMNLGNGEMAAELFQRGLEQSTGAKLIARPMLLVGSSFLAMGGGDMEGAKNLIADAGEFAYERGMKHMYPMVAFANGQFAMASGNNDEAIRCFTEAENQALSMNMRPMVWQSRAFAAQALTALDRSEDAQAKMEGVQDMVDEIASLFEDRDLRQKYVESMARKLG